MTVSTRCTFCDKEIELAEKWEGQTYTCPACGKPFTVRDQSTLLDGSMILEQARSSPAASASASVVGSRLGDAIRPTPHSQLRPNDAPIALQRPAVKMDLGIGDESPIATGLIFVGYGSAVVLQIVDLTRSGMIGKLPLTFWVLYVCVWLAMFALVAPITNIGMQLAAKMVGESFGPTLFRMYGLLAVPPAAAFVGMLCFGKPGMVIGVIAGVLLMAPFMWIMYGLGVSNTLVAFLMSAVFFVLSLIVYGVVVFLLAMMFGLMGLATGERPGRGTSGLAESAMSQPERSQPLFSQPGFSAPPPPRIIEQKQYTRIDSTDAAVKVLGESDPAERRRALTYLAGLDMSTVNEAARFQVGQALKERLDDSEADIARRAGPMLMAWSPALACDTFSLRLENSSQEQRRQAIAMLSELGDKRAIKPITARLADDTAEASAALLKFGEDAEPDVLAALSSERPEMRRAAMVVLQSIGTSACLPVIKPLAGDADTQIAGPARALWKKLEPATFDAITEAMLLLQSTTAADRVDGLKKLAAEKFDAGRAGGITPMVEKLLADSDADVAMAAAKAVGKYHRDDLAAELASWFDEPTDDPARRKVAMMALGYMQHLASAPKIIKWLSMDPQTASQALIAMGPGAEPAILAVMPAREDEAMAAACTALEQIGTRRSLILLNSVSTMRSNAEVRAAAKQARQAIIERLRAESVTP